MSHNSLPGRHTEQKTYATLISVDQYRSLAVPFFADYANKHAGRRPFINPGPLSRWTWGQENGGNEAYDVAVQNKTIFKKWWESGGGFGKADPETCSEGIYVYPFTTGTTQYRNEYFEYVLPLTLVIHPVQSAYRVSAPTIPPMGFSDSRIAVMAGTPDVVVPVGEIGYNSTISLEREYMPVTMSFVVARGCDFMLAELISELEGEGVLRGVRTGSRMYG